MPDAGADIRYLKTGFVTVAEAAKALGLSERQVRRLVARLEPTDKRHDPNRQHKGAPVTLVRLASVEGLHQSAFLEGEPTGKANGHATDTPVESTGKPTDTPVVAPVELLLQLADMEKRAAVAEARAELLEAERDRLQARVEQDSERLGEALRALAQAQDETRAVRALSTRANVGLIEPQGAQNHDSGGDTGQGGEVGTPNAQKRPWWAFWRDR